MRKHLYAPKRNQFDPEEIKDLILSFVVNYMQQWGYSPTVREIATKLSIPSTSTAQKYLDELVTDGRMEKRARLSRTLRPVL